MSHTYREEVECTIGEHETVISICTDVTCTYAGCPASGPTYSSGGEPAEGPEFECGEAYLELEGLQGIVRMKKEQLDALFGDIFITAFFDRAEENAAENYDPSDDEPDERDYD